MYNQSPFKASNFICENFCRVLCLGANIRVNFDWIMRTHRTAYNRFSRHHGWSWNNCANDTHHNRILTRIRFNIFVYAGHRLFIGWHSKCYFWGGDHIGRQQTKGSFLVTTEDTWSSSVKVNRADHGPARNIPMSVPIIFVRIRALRKYARAKCSRFYVQ